jgi:hypothetical protein
MLWLHDTRTDCLSALGTLTTGEYLGLVKDAHERRGGTRANGMFSKRPPLSEFEIGWLGTSERAPFSLQL